MGGCHGSSTADGPLTLSLSGGAAGSAAHRPAACATKEKGDLFTICAIENYCIPLSTGSSTLHTFSATIL